MRLIRTLVRISALAVCLQAAIAQAAPLTGGAHRRRSTTRSSSSWRRPSITGASFSADEKQILFSSNETRHLQRLHGCRWPAASRVPLTQLDAPTRTYAVAFFRTTTASSSPATRAATSSTTSTCATRRRGEGPDPGREAEGDVRRLEPGRQRLLRPDQRARPALFDLYRYDAKTYARTLLYKDEAGYDLRRISRRRAMARAPQDRTPRPTATSTSRTPPRSEMKHITPHTGAGRRTSAATFDPAVEAALLPDQRRRRVHRASARYDLATRRDEGGREGRLGRARTVFSQRRQLPRHRHQRGRPHRRPRVRRRPTKAGGAAQAAGRRHHQVTFSPQRERAGLLRQRRPLAQQPLRVRPRTRPGRGG